jgi:hypothetical protein
MLTSGRQTIELKSGRIRACAAALFAMAGVLIGAPSASALVIEAPVYSGTTIQQPTDGSTGFFGVTKLASDQASDNLYVAAGGRVFKFDTTNNQSEAFSGLAGKSYIQIPFEYYATCCGDLEIDNSGTATQGRIFAFEEQAGTAAFFPTGVRDETFKPVGEAVGICGAATHPDGHYWVNRFESSLDELDPIDGSSTGKKLFPNAFGGLAHDGCDFDFDSKGNFYISNHWSGPAKILKYNAAGQFQYSLGSNTASTMAVDPSNDNVFVNDRSKVLMYSSGGSLLATFGNKPEGTVNGGGPYNGLSSSEGITVDADTHKVYVSNQATGGVDIFVPGPPIIGPDVSTEKAVPTLTTATLKGTVNPSGVNTKKCFFEWGVTTTYGKPIVPCAEGNVLEGAADISVSGGIAGLAEGETYNFRLVVENDNGVTINGANRSFRTQGKPIVVGQFVDGVKGDVVRLNAELNPNFGDTTYHFEYGKTTSYGTTVPIPDAALKPITGVHTVGETIFNLELDTEYHYRVVATNDAGTTEGGDRTFVTYPPFNEVDACPNALARQQTGAVLLDDCRAYELVSASNTGGYNVESSVVPGQAPLPAYPGAQGRVLYGVHNGGIPGTGSPTNKGVDPYVATRSESGIWTTRYVGIPADGTPSAAPFASTFLAADQALETLAFSGPEICAPCFDDGSAGIPLRMPDGSLIQGMKGTLAPSGANPVGFVAKPLSDDGSHFIFGADKKFEPVGNEGSVSIYDRNLATGMTQVVSTLPGSGVTMSGEVGQLDVSSDGSRIVVGQWVSTDAAGNDYWHPYMHLGTDSKTVDLAPGGASGVLYAGMSTDGTQVFFTTKDKLVTPADADESPDLYMAEVGSGGGPATLTLLTGLNSDACDPAANGEGNNWNAVGVASVDGCGPVAIGGGGGVGGESGAVYFLSPEKLDGTGALNQPNLFVVEDGGTPKRVTTLDPDDPVVRDSVKDSEIRRSDLFQASSNGQYAVFAVTASLTGFDNHGALEVFRYSVADDEVECASCAASRARPAGDATLTAEGLSVIDDGRVFFTTPESLVLRDTGERQDAYEWTNGDARLISSGISPFHSAFFSASADGTDAQFFTRETLVKGDHNGTLMKLYDAREGGGFFVVPDPPPCAASDECHGPGSPKPAAQTVGSFAGSAGNASPKSCRKGFMKKRGHCVKKKPRKKKRHGKRRNG